MFGKHACDVCGCVCVKQKVVVVESERGGGREGGGAAMRPHQLQPRCLLPAAPNDSAPYPGCHLAGLGRGCRGSVGEAGCPRLTAGVSPGGVTALSGADMSVVRLGSFSKSKCFSPFC